MPGAGQVGIVLLDTMRKGSDYWRPGSLLTQVADCIRQGVSEGCAVIYVRDDCWCPTPRLLEQSRNVGMRFGEYAAQYARELKQAKGLESAAYAVIAANALKMTPAFYCTDPYVPDFGDSDAAARDVPYDQREWLDDRPGFRDLSQYGCHRVVFAEELAKIPTTGRMCDGSRGRPKRARARSPILALVVP